MTGRTLGVGFAVGFAGGVVSGLLGVGGGIVIVPGLVLALGFAQRPAHATSLAAIVPLGAAGAGMYAVNGGRLHLGLALALSIGAVIGAPLGARALAHAPETWLRTLFVLAVFAAGIRLVLP